MKAPHIDLRELSVRESEQVEWKENVADIDDVVATLCAFANDAANLGGGYVVCGAREARDEHGFPSIVLTGLTASRLKEVEGKVTARCRERVSPPIAPVVEELPAVTPDRRILVFTMPATRHAHLFRRDDESGRYYVRISRETREARNGLLRELLVRKGDLEPWDQRPCLGATLEDIDLLALRDTLQRIRVFDPARGIDDVLVEDAQISPFVPSLCVREPLQGTLRPRNFTILLFGRRVQFHIPGAYSLFSIYPGVDRSEPHAERHEIAGTLLEQARRLTDFLNTQAYVAYDKTDTATPNAVKYPQRALHEAMINALAHRDYELPDPTRLTVFLDRIEIVSPGTLPPGVALADLREGQASPRWRNQSLAWFLSRLQLAQAEGQGIPTIFRTMREEGCPAPRFDADAARVTCVLPAHPRHALIREQQTIERALSLGELTSARDSIAVLLERDPFNFRTVQLFAEVHRALGDTGPVLDLVRRHRAQLHSFAPFTLIQLAETLLAVEPTPEERDAARELLRTASHGHFEEREARRIALSLFKAKDDAGALEFLERTLRDRPELRGNPTLLQLRGRGLLQLAKRCTETGENRRLPYETRARAWKDCRAYLDQAERDLREALAQSSDAALADHAHRDLDFLHRLREKATPRPRR